MQTFSMPAFLLLGDLFSRTEEEEEYDKKVYRKKAHQLKKKMHILPALFKNKFVVCL